MVIVFLVTLISDSSLAGLVITTAGLPGGGIPLLGELVQGEEFGSMMWDGEKIPVHAHVHGFRLSSKSHFISTICCCGGTLPDGDKWRRAQTVCYFRPTSLDIL